MENKPHIIRAGIAWAVLLGFMLVSQPQKLPVILLVVPFVLLFVALMSTWVALVPIARRLVGKRGYAGSPRLRVTVCGSVVLLMVMQSLGQLMVRDMLTILAIVTIGYLYLGRSRSLQRSK